MDSIPANVHHDEALIMAPSIGLHFSGINATMEALLPKMRKTMKIACCGGNLSDRMPRSTLWKWLRAKNRRRWRIWHSRRNNDMLLGLFLRNILRQKLILLFTSAAQREHTWLTKFCYHHMDAVIATTQIAADFLDCPSVISHHGVDSSVFKKSEDCGEVRRLIGLENRPTLGIFGRVRPQKGTSDLVEALIVTLDQFPQWQVVFVGAITERHIPFKKRLEERLVAAGLSNRVSFIGFLDDFSQLPKWYQAVDVVGCVSRKEGFGVTCLEGMSSGSPVLATHAGAWPEIITEGEDGWLARPNDSADLSRALQLVFSKTPEQLKQMGRVAQQTIHDRFTIEQEVMRITEVYKKLFEKYGEDWQRMECDSTSLLNAA